MNRYIITALLLVLVGSRSVLASSQNVPVIMNAPVVLYDEANNLLENGGYEATVQIRDGLGNVLFSEEQSLTVKNGIAQLAVGQGYAAGSEMASPSGGLSHEVFLSQTDVDVYIWVRGVASEQHIGTLATAPYAFVSQFAHAVADDSIDSKNIRDGSITLNDLSQAVLDRMSQGSGTESVTQINASEETTTTTVPLSSVVVENTLGLNNASGSNLETVLQSLDNAIDAVREIHLDQGLGQVETSLTSTINSTQTTLQSGINDVSTRLDGLDFSQISDTLVESQADPLLARDSEITSALEANNALTGGIHGLGTGSFFVGTSDAQELTNKIFGNATLFRGNITLSDADCEGGICLVDGEDLSDVAGRVGSLETASTSLTSDLSTLQSSVSQNSANISTQASQITSLQSSVSQNASNLSTHSSEIAALQASVSQNNANFSTQASQITALQSSISQNTANIGTHSSQIGSLQSQTAAIPAVSSSVSALQGTVNTQGNSISTLDSNLISLSSTVSEMNTQLNQTQNDLNSLSIEVAGVNSSVSSITQVFAFGHYEGGVCTGENIQNGTLSNACNFISSAGNNSYAVTITPTSTAPCSIQAPIMTTPVKSANGFQVAGYCYGSSNPANSGSVKFDFIVYKW